MINVTIWNEHRHERDSEEIAAVHPKGIHGTIAEFLEREADITVRTACLDDPDHGLGGDVLENTDVLIWWGHIAHEEVRDDIAEKVHARVLQGMGFIALHSAHKCKPLMKLLGTTCNLRWREADESMRLWTVEPAHPIARGVPAYIDLEREEMYGERFDIPAPDELVFIGWFKGGEVFRSGCCFRRGAGNIFYFQPGHESYANYRNEHIQRIITNAVYWAKTERYTGSDACIHAEEPLEKLG